MTRSIFVVVALVALPGLLLAQDNRNRAQVMQCYAACLDRHGGGSVGAYDLHVVRRFANVPFGDASRVCAFAQDRAYRVGACREGCRTLAKSLTGHRDAGRGSDLYEGLDELHAAATEGMEAGLWDGIPGTPLLSLENRHAWAAACAKYIKYIRAPEQDRFGWRAIEKEVDCRVRHDYFRPWLPPSPNPNRNARADKVVECIR